MNKKQVLLCLFALGMNAVPTFAGNSYSGDVARGIKAAPDNKVVKGTVSDAAGPLIGATIKVAGTPNGTVTDFEGNFSIQCAPGATLEISYVGYKTKSMKAQNGMSVILE